jgi:hypothetical protein
MQAVQARGRFCKLILCEKKKMGNTFPLIFDVVKILEHNAAPPVVVDSVWPQHQASHEDGLSRA